MNKRVMILALASFAFGTQTFVFSGLLARLAADLGVSIGGAGQLTSVFAIVYAVAAPIMAGLAAPYNRKRILVLALGALFVLNVAAAYMPDFGSLLALRVLSGLASTLVTPVAAAAAATLVPPHLRGKALAIVLAGLTLAFVVGIPLGSVIGDVFGWRSTFTFSGLLALVAAIGIALVLPSVPSGDRAGLRALAVAFDIRVLANLMFTLTAFAATSCSIAYIGPVVTAISGLEGKGVGLMQALIGGGMIAGVLVGGVVADKTHSTRAVTSAFVVVGLAQVLLTALMVMDQPGAPLPALGLALALLLGAGALFALSPIVQTRLVGVAPHALNVVLALNSSAIFLGQGVGTVVGGLAIEALGLAYVGLAGGSIALLGVLFGLAASRQRAVVVAVS